MSVEQGTLADATQRPLPFGQTMQAVFWSFFGVRRSRDMGTDVLSRIGETASAVLEGLVE